MEEYYSDALECSKCGQNVDQILALQCDHNLCLACASKTVANSNQKNEIINYIKCEICGVQTMLDPNSTQILSELKDQYLYQEAQNVQNNQKNLYPPTPSQYNMKESIQVTKFIVPCREHPSEEAILYCYTCETPCICVECCLNGLHKGHDLKNVLKNYDQLQNYVEDLRFKVKVRADILVNDENRLTQKKREIIEVVSQSKQHIKQSFDDLHAMIEEKQKELMQNCQEIMQEKFEDLDFCITQVHESTQYLQDFDQRLEQIYYNSQKNPENQINAYNFYADNKNKILQTLKEMDVNFFTSIQDKMQLEFRLDMNSLYQHLESIKSVKLEVMCLRGVESALPSQNDQNQYNKVLEQKSKRQFDNLKSNKQSEKQEEDILFLQERKNLENRQLVMKNDESNKILTKQKTFSDYKRKL